MSSLLARTASAGRPSRLVWVVRDDQPASSERRQADQAIVEGEVLSGAAVLVAPRLPVPLEQLRLASTSLAVWPAPARPRERPPVERGQADSARSSTDRTGPGPRRRVEASRAHRPSLLR